MYIAPSRDFLSLRLTRGISYGRQYDCTTLCTFERVEVVNDRCVHCHVNIRTVKITPTPKLRSLGRGRGGGAALG